MAKYLGVDISAHNRNINYKKLKKAKLDGRVVKFAFLRLASPASNNTVLDSMFETHYAGCKAAGIHVGVYLYSYAKTPAEAVTEAKFVINALKDKVIDYPVVFDYEDQTLIDLNLGKAKYTAIAKAFCDTLKAANYYPMIYTNPDWYTNRLNSTALKDYDLWLAHWTSEGYQRQLGQTIWQFAALGTETEVSKNWATKVGTLDGSGGPIDVNWAYVGYAAKIKKLKMNNTATLSKCVITATKEVTSNMVISEVKKVTDMGYKATYKKI